MNGGTLPPDFAARLAAVRDEMRELGRPDARLIAVTKAFPPALVADAVAAGVTDLGENYAQEVVGKRDAFGTATVHFIGRIQRNKVRKIAELKTVKERFYAISVERKVRHPAVAALYASARETIFG